MNARPSAWSPARRGLGAFAGLLGLLAGPAWGFCAVTVDELDLGGRWEGSIAAGGQSIRTVLHLAQDETGSWSGTVDSPEQRVFGLSLAQIEIVEGTALSFDVPDTFARWEGRLAEENGDRLVGTWKQRGAELPLEFIRLPDDRRLGAWSGRLELGGTKLRVEFHVGTFDDGSLGASMRSPDQSPQPIPVTSVESREDGGFRMEITNLRVVYEGSWSDDGTVMEGRFTQAGVEVPLKLVRAAAPKPRRRPQTPQPPFPYHTEDVRYRNDSAGIELAGTFTRPHEGGPFPVALLITGSGPQDRDETLLEHKPFLVIADHLTRRGIAVLRVDDRGVGGSTGSMATATSADFATDVHAGLDFLSERDDVDAARMGLIGHSEGGLIAPMVAAERSSVAFLVLLAGPGTDGATILDRQAALIARAGGASEEAIESNRELQQKMFAALREEEDLDVAAKRIRADLEEFAASSGQQLDDPEVRSALQAQVTQSANPWFRFFVTYDPTETLRHVTAPVLAVNGALDLQVPATENLAAIEAALLEAGNEDVTVEEWPNLNHLFQHCESGHPSEYLQIEETFSEEVLERIGGWILERFGDEP